MSYTEGLISAQQSLTIPIKRKQVWKESFPKYYYISSKQLFIGMESNFI